MNLTLLLASVRFDIGLGNPNKTAAVIVLAMVAAWIIPYIWSRGIWLTLALTIYLGYLLLHTGSRGGIVALASGYGILLPRFWKRGSRRHTILAIVLFVAVIGCAASGCFSSRYVNGITRDDASISNRLLIWKCVPRMMADAPSGWGLGKSGEAYMQWYQPFDRFESYRTLVNSHFTWLVELGWMGRASYLFAWLAILSLCWFRNEKCEWFVVPFSIWVAFAVSALFSTVAECGWIWGLPLLALAAVIVARTRMVLWPSPIQWLKLILVTIALIFLLYSTGHYFGNDGTVHFDSYVTRIGYGNSKMIIFAPDKAIVGDHYGQSIRKHKIDAEIVFRVDDLVNRSITTLVLTGYSSNVPSGLAIPKLVFINPKCNLPKEVTNGNPRIEVIWGEFVHSAPRKQWSIWASKLPDVDTKIAAGCADYIDDWARFLERGKNSGNW